MANLRRRASALTKRLRKAYPDAHCELDFSSPFQLLIATILSAQCTDKSVNAATPALFKAYPDARSLAQALLPEVEARIKSIGLFRGKARNIVNTARILVSEHGGRVPKNMDALVALPGVGRKTANVVLFNGFGMPGLAVDTHVLRVGKRLGLFSSQEPVEVEKALNALLKPEDWGLFSHLLIWHGRRICAARSPSCGACALNDLCPSAFKV
ncbi:MAG: endonuclease III [candidate division FCPU426 bacterium]